MELLIEILGIIGITASIISFQCKSHKGILIFRTVNEFFFGVQYLLLGAYTGMAMNIVGCGRNVIFTETVKKGKNTRFWVILFSVFFTVFGIVTWQGPKSILVIVAKVLSTLAYSSKNTAFCRRLVLVTASAWLVYNVSVGSTAGAVNEALTLGSIIIGIIRLDILPRLKKAQA